MSEEIQLSAVNHFRQIKSEAGCDDMVAAILTLAQSIPDHVTVYPGDDGNFLFDRVGKDIAEAIEKVTKDGAIRVSTEGEVLNTVRGMIDTVVGGPGKSNPKAPKKKKR